MIAKPLLLISCVFFTVSIFGQYTLNGNASKNDCHCYTLTNDALRQSGSVWNNNKISLAQSFDFKFDVFLGCTDSLGADGIAFVLQPISTSVGTQGGGLGYSGVKPSVGITIDTWQNGSPTSTVPDADPLFDHIAIQLNGDLDHKNSAAPYPINNIAGPVSALANSINIEDCQWHILRIVWDAPAKTLTAYMDGVLRVSTVKDFTTDVFGGNPLVYWGFTGSTGGSKNLQQMCTALKPIFKFLPGQKICVGEKIAFIDSTISFAPIAKSYWDFGDGSPIDSINTSPVHTYAAAGNYTIVQTVLGADGCIELNKQQILVGSIPVANFTFNNACVLDAAVNLNNTSSVTFGTINNWFWDFGNGDTGMAPNPSKWYSTPGLKKVKLSVKSIEGCVSDTTAIMVRVFEKPVAAISFIDSQCLDTPVQLNGIAGVSDGTIVSWIWNVDSLLNKPSFLQDPLQSYDSPGAHLVSLFTKSSNGCVSMPVIKSLNILPKPVADFSNPPVCLNTPVVFSAAPTQAGTGVINNWWWQLGNGTTSGAQNPVTSYTNAGAITVELVVKNNNGCLSDTMKKIINIESTPTALFGFSSPTCAGQPILFSDSSVITQGTISDWFWQTDNGNIVNSRNLTAVFTSGNHQVRLFVKNGKGCNSDTTTANLFIHPRPGIDFSFSNACKGALVSFTGTNRPGDVVRYWQWKFDDGSMAQSKDTQHVYSAGGNFNVQLYGVSQAGCFSDTIQKNITIYATNAFAGNDTIAAPNQPVQLQASGGVNYEWRPATGLSNAFIANPVAVNNVSRTYILRAYTPAGCSTFDTVRVAIFDGPEIYVPRAFTPNGDGLNELLRALPVGIRQFSHFTVYNRLGQIVFYTPVATRGWDGFFKGKLQHAGTYLWIAEAVGYRGNIIQRKGTVVLVR